MNFERERYSTLASDGSIFHKFTAAGSIEMARAGKSAGKSSNVLNRPTPKIELKIKLQAGKVLGKFKVIFLCIIKKVV